MTAHYLDFEKPLYALEAQIRELRRHNQAGGVNVADEVLNLQKKIERSLANIYAHLSPWQKVQVARHPARPHCLDYVDALLEDFTPLAGDRAFGDDQALIGGLGRLRGRTVCVLGHEKGADMESRMKYNFGMPRPEGYRKASRLLALADRFSLPVVSFIDTPGAYPGVDAEARGQAEAIARCLHDCLEVDVPVVSLIIGEGGSGGAVAIAAANVVLMLEHAVYSVISPEGCSSILWRSRESSREAASALKMTAQDLLNLGLIDGVIAEPRGGAHRQPAAAIAAGGEALGDALENLLASDIRSFKEHRREKFLAMGRRFVNA